ncbi:MAG: glycosyltransferase family 2 protein [Treponema sp.]|nr:glycosyltransferase family 2 protein [Candidatus Treponema equifaecale]
MAQYTPAFLIPVYNHGKACIQVVDSLADYCHSTGTKVILVDDGNGQETKDCLAQIKASHPDFVDLVVCPKNGGKGLAFKAGVIRAKEMGITHVLQIDADGQHDASRVPFFFEQSKLAPDAMICGYPEYDETAPKHRLNAHSFANMWCAIVTWSRGIVDALCGFRVYPVEATYDFVTKHRYDARMGFDTEILIKLIWKNVPYKFFPVKVTYPTDGISNFHAVRDNIRISWVFTKLCGGMLLRIPLFILRLFTGSVENPPANINGPCNG